MIKMRAFTTEALDFKDLFSHHFVFICASKPKFPWCSQGKNASFYKMSLGFQTPVLQSFVWFLKAPRIGRWWGFGGGIPSNSLLTKTRFSTCYGSTFNSNTTQTASDYPRNKEHTAGPAPAHVIISTSTFRSVFCWCSVR